MPGSFAVGFRVDAVATSAGGAAPAFDPLALAPFAVFDAISSPQFTDAGTTPAVVTDAVQQINDLTANANQVSQATASARFVRGADEWALGGDDFMTRLAALTGLPGAQPYTIVSVGRMTTNSTNLFGLNASGGLFGRLTTATSARANFGAQLGGTYPDLGNRFALLIEANGASSNVYVNNVLIVSGNLGAQLVDRLVLGAFTGGVAPIVGGMSYWAGHTGLLSAGNRTAYYPYLQGRFPGLP